VAERDPVDYSSILANERTFLADLRTALALQIAVVVVAPLVAAIALALT